MTEIRNRFSS